MPDIRPTDRCPAALGAVVAVLLLAQFSFAQGPKASALKLPDGTVVLYTPTPDAQNPPVEGVFLSGKEYQALLDQADQLRKQKDAPKPQSPSRCQIRGRIDAAGSQPVAVLTATYSYRTTTPRTVVALGGLRGQPRTAKTADGRLPVLAATDDGLTVFVESAGEHTLIVEFETPVSARGPGGELGFDLGLPRAPVTTFAFEPPPTGKNPTVGLRASERLLYRPDLALGPADRLDVTWEPPAPPGATAAREPSADSDITVRIDETQVETVTKIRLRGPVRDWPLLLPPGAEVSAEQPGVRVVRPTDPAKPVWVVKVPDDPAAEWLVTAVVRQPRAKPADPNARTPIPIGPVAVPAARHAGTVRVSAPPAVAVRFRPGPDVRRQDVPPGAGDETVALFRFAVPPRPGDRTAAPLLTAEARPTNGFVRIEPAYRLRLTPAGWVLTADLKIAPVRAEVDEFRVELPAGWRGAVEASARRADAAEELVDEVEVSADGDGPRELTVRLVGPQKQPFDLTLSAVHPVPAGTREAVVALPRFPRGVVEQSARLTAEVPTGLELQATAAGRERGPAGDPVELKPASGATVLTAGFDRGIGQVSLAWQPHRPEVTARVEVEVTLQDRQAMVAETIHLKADGAALRMARFRGPAAATPTLNAPLLRQVGDAGEWELAATTKDAATVTMSYVLPIQARADRLDLGLFWPDAATRVETQVRVWGGPGVRRVSGFDGPWQKLPPEPAEGRDALPWLTLSGAGAGLKLGLDLADPAAGPLPGAWVDRARFRAWAGGAAVAVHGRFVVRRWAAAGVDLVVPPGVLPDVFVDGRRSDNLLPASGGAVRVPVPEPKPGRAGVVLDVWYSTPAPAAGPLTLTPPELVGAAYRGPSRWQVFAPPGVVPLDPGGAVLPDGGWAWRNGIYAPAPDADPDDATGPDAAPAWAAAARQSAPAEALSGRQAKAGPVALVRVPRPAWVAGCSMVSLLLILGLARLRPIRLGPAVAALGVAAAVVAAGWPQPAAEAAAGGQPGTWVAAAVLAGQAGLRWYQRRQVTHLPGFTRTRPAVEANGSAGGVLMHGPRSDSAAVPFGSGSNPSGSARGVRAGA